MWARDRERLTQISVPASLRLQGFVTVWFTELIGDMELSLAATNLGQLHHETILVETPLLLLPATWHLWSQNRRSTTASRKTQCLYIAATLQLPYIVKNVALSSKSQKAHLGHRQNPNSKEAWALLLGGSLLAQVCLKRYTMMRNFNGLIPRWLQVSEVLQYSK